MFSKNDKKTDKTADKTLDTILKMYTSAIDEFNILAKANHKKLYEYYSSSHIVRKCDYLQYWTREI